MVTWVSNYKTMCTDWQKRNSPGCMLFILREMPTASPSQLFLSVNKLIWEECSTGNTWCIASCSAPGREISEQKRVSNYQGRAVCSVGPPTLHLHNTTKSSAVCLKRCRTANQQAGLERLLTLSIRLNGLAHVLTRTSLWDHNSPTLASLHFLPVKYRRELKIGSNECSPSGSQSSIVTLKLRGAWQQNY